MTADVVVSGEELASRTILRKDLKPDQAAFLDTKIPGSQNKTNYPLIGPGVSENAEQVVPVTAPHGFNLGGAVMPAGVVNNLHLHFTAEVFVCFAGRWQFRWGVDGTDGEAEVAEGDVISIPTWIFRGFTNTGDTDGWIFTALGGDDTGGIIWHPSILQNAAQYGMFLTKDNMLVDTGAGAPRPAPDALMPPLRPEQIANLPRYTPEQMLRRVVPASERAWSAAALLDAGLPGHASELAPVIGHGMTEDRAHAAPIGNPHGFSIEWLRIPAGNGVGRHRLAEKQVIIPFTGALDVTLNEPGDAVAVHVATGECFSAPGGAWRSLAAAGDTAVEAVLITAGDARKRITWAPEIVAAAMQAGTVLDHDGHVAPLDLLPPPTRIAVAARMMQAAE
jgi:quercetin dioxygenase-like cupin family protein